MLCRGSFFHGAGVTINWMFRRLQKRQQICYIGDCTGAYDKYGLVFCIVTHGTERYWFQEKRGKENVSDRRTGKSGNKI